MDIEAAQALWKSDNVDEWRQALDQYPYVLEEFSKTAPRRKTLSELHKWIENDLRPRLSKDRYLSQNDLSKLMKFKLARGKFRPRLQQFIDSLSDSEVKNATQEAADMLPKTKAPPDTQCENALARLTSLKGVGPAFASLILSLFSEYIAFMGDELLQATGDRVYDKRRLKQLNSQVQQKAAGLGQSFSCRELEIAVFSVAHKPNVKDSLRNAASSGKRNAGTSPSSNVLGTTGAKTKSRNVASGHRE
eukprot:gb/GECG01016780.1/.p1 GENE.gb/GECG01016780.1/~~gb/GECG01016780.1/.p1  ORF type:complete len:248 (+),score=35.66 gb/GECG01016780.1/:1-744(+)